MTDVINHPSHYKSAGGIEAIDVIESFNLNFHRGNSVKYLLRAGSKDNELQDLYKSNWYQRREIARMEAMRGKVWDLAQFSLLYLATPYTKWTDLDAAANEAARINAALVKEGLNVFSPIVLGHQLAVIGGLPPRDPALWPRFCAPYVDACDALIVVHMPGWQESTGITAEIRAFKESRRPIFDLDPQTLAYTRREG